MAYIDVLIDRISDKALRHEIKAQVGKLSTQKKFGLVFEEHLPEMVVLPEMKVKKGDKAVIDGDKSLWRVVDVGGAEAELRSVFDVTRRCSVPIESLSVVREFGDPIYPGLRSVDRIERGDAKPYHAVLNAENFHAVETLIYPLENKVDCIYIDPPYNTGARDWKYNNDFVDRNDVYRHSKWLAFMERRLNLCKRLLNRDDSVLIVTIDEHEVSRLGLLLEQVFPTAEITLVTIVNNTKGVTRPGVFRFSRVHEYAFFCFFGNAGIGNIGDDLLNDTEADTEDDDGDPEDPETAASGEAVLLDDGTKETPGWRKLLRSGDDPRREDREQMFYPIWIDPETRRIVHVGDYLPLDQAPSFDPDEHGLMPVWPVRNNKSLGRWGVGPNTLRELVRRGFVAVGRYQPKRKTWGVSYLTKQIVADIDNGLWTVGPIDSSTGVAPVWRDGSDDMAAASRKVKTVWFRIRHNAGVGGTQLVSDLTGMDRPFSFPKSVFAVRDTLAAVTTGKPNALILDFFAGSGTTLHAAAMLNREDGGNRRVILVTNNEVEEKARKLLTEQGVKPLSRKWEEHGIFYRATIPRIRSAITGVRPDGTPVPSHLTNFDGSPMLEGLAENVEFFELTYEDPSLLAIGRRFEAIAPLLWLRAGGRGRRIDKVDPAGWSAPHDAAYAVLFDVSSWRQFLAAISNRSDLNHIFVVTDSLAAFQQVASELAPETPVTRLYESYLRSFRINTGSTA